MKYQKALRAAALAIAILPATVGAALAQAHEPSQLMAQALQPYTPVSFESAPSGDEVLLPRTAGAALPPASSQAGPILRPGKPSAEFAFDQPMFQDRNRGGVPWIVAGAAMIVGGAIVGDDAGTLLMAGGVGLTAYGLFIYF